MAWLIEAYLEEGLLDKIKEKRDENKKLAEKQRQIRLAYREEEEKFIKKEIKEVYDAYLKILKSALTKHKITKVKFAYLNNKTNTYNLGKSADKFFNVYSFENAWSDEIFFDHGIIPLFSIDIYNYSKATGIPARDMQPEYIGPLITPIEKTLKEYKAKYPGIKYGGLCNEGYDRDDYKFAIKFTSEFMTDNYSRFKKEFEKKYNYKLP